MEMTQFSVVGPQDLIKDLVAQLPAKDSRITVNERPGPAPEKGGAAAEPFSTALLGCHELVSAAVLYEALRLAAGVIKRWFQKPNQHNRECELLIRSPSGEQHHVKFKVAMSENEIADALIVCPVAVMGCCKK